MSQLVRRNAEVSKSGNARRDLPTLLATLQESYRTLLSELEHQLWMESLRDYEYPEIEAAVMEMMKYPPKYTLEDGSIQVWRGMPKLPDVLQTILARREEAQRKALVAREQQKRQDEARELDDLKKRKAAGEKFWTLEEIAKEFFEKHPPTQAKPGSVQAVVEKHFQEHSPEEVVAKAERLRSQGVSDEQWEQRKAVLRRQAEEIERKLRNANEEAGRKP